MERYHFSDLELRHLEQLPTPLAVYQFSDGHVYTLALSDGYCELFGYPDKAEAYRLVNMDVYYNTHPDDVARVEEAVRRFIAESGRYEVIFRGKMYHGQEYRIVHGIGKHVYRENGVRLAYVSFTDEGEYTGDTDAQATALNKTFNSALHDESLLKATHFDDLTGLPNMTYFFELAAEAKKVILEDGGVAALLYMDLKKAISCCRHLPNYWGSHSAGITAAASMRTDSLPIQKKKNWRACCSSCSRVQRY